MLILSIRHHPWHFILSTKLATGFHPIHEPGGRQPLDGHLLQCALLPLDSVIIIQFAEDPIQFCSSIQGIGYRTLTTDIPSMNKPSTFANPFDGEF